MLSALRREALSCVQGYSNTPLELGGPGGTMAVVHKQGGDERAKFCKRWPDTHAFQRLCRDGVRGVATSDVSVSIYSNGHEKGKQAG